MANFKRYITTISNNPHSVFSALIQRLRRVFPIDYLMGNGYSFPPELVIILPTKRCNFFCAHCAARGHVSSEKEQELSISEFCSIIVKISVFKPYVYFSGGEPFLRNDIFELVRYIKKKKLVLVDKQGIVYCTAKNRFSVQTITISCL